MSGKNDTTGNVFFDGSDMENILPPQPQEENENVDVNNKAIEDQEPELQEDVKAASDKKEDKPGEGENEPGEGHEANEKDTGKPPEDGGEPGDNVKHFIEGLGGDINKVAAQAINHQKLATYRQNLVNAQEKTIADLNDRLNKLEQESKGKTEPGDGIDIDGIDAKLYDAETPEQRKTILREVLKAKQEAAAEQSINEATTKAIYNHNANIYLEQAKTFALEEAKMTGNEEAIARLQDKSYQVTDDEFNAVLPQLRILQSTLSAFGNKAYNSDEVEYALFKMQGSRPTADEIVSAQPTRKVMQPNGTEKVTGKTELTTYDDAMKYASGLSLDALNKLIDQLE